MTQLLGKERHAIIDGAIDEMIKAGFNQLDTYPATADFEAAVERWIQSDAAHPRQQAYYAGLGDLGFNRLVLAVRRKWRERVKES